MGLKLITPPTYTPVTLAEAKAHLRITHTDDDLTIALLLDSATRFIENFLGRALAAQTWELILDEFPTNEIKIPLPPLIEIISVKYDDEDGVEQTVDPLDYEVDTANEPGWVVPILDVDWPETIEAINAVRIRFRAGYISTDSPPAEDDSAIPFDIKAALFLTLASFFEHRENIVVGETATLLPFGADALLRQHRVQISMA